MGDHPALTIILGFIAVMLLIGVVLFAVMIYVIFKYRVPLRGIAAMVGALVYLISPVDVLPEAVLGPFGLIDDAGVLGAAGFFVYRLIQAKRIADGIAHPDGRAPSRPDRPAPSRLDDRGPGRPGSRAVLPRIGQKPDK